MSDLHFLTKTIANVDAGQTLTSAITFAAYICIQAAEANTGNVYINSAQGEAGTGYTLETGSTAYSLSDPWGRNVFDLSKIYVTADNAGDIINVLYWTNPRLNVRDLLQQMQWHLQESENGGDSLTTEQWAFDDWVNELSAAHTILCSEAATHVWQGRQTGTAFDMNSFFCGDLVGTHPIDLKRLAIIDGTTGASTVLQPSSTWVYDYGSGSGTPTGYSIVEDGTGIIRLLPESVTSRTLEAHFTGYQEDLTGKGEMFAVPDELACYIKWGAMGMLLAYAGPGADPVRAEYCRQRFDEGIKAARLLAGDWYA